MLLIHIHVHVHGEAAAGQNIALLAALCLSYCSHAKEKES